MMLVMLDQFLEAWNIQWNNGWATVKESCGVFSRNESVTFSLGSNPSGLTSTRPCLSKTAAASTICCALLAYRFMVRAVYMTKPAMTRHVATDYKPQISWASLRMNYPDLGARRPLQLTRQTTMMTVSLLDS